MQFESEREMIEGDAAFLSFFLLVDAV